MVKLSDIGSMNCICERGGGDVLFTQLLVSRKVKRCGEDQGADRAKSSGTLDSLLQLFLQLYCDSIARIPGFNPFCLGVLGSLT